MEQIGFVRKVTDNKIEVEVKRVAGCGDNCKSCGSSCDSPNHVIVLQNSIGAQVGDLIELKGETGNVLKYAMIVYMIPFAMLLLGIIGGIKVLQSYEVANYEPLSFLIGIIFLAIGYIFVRLIDRRIGKKDDNIIKIVRII